MMIKNRTIQRCSIRTGNRLLQELIVAAGNSFGGFCTTLGRFRFTSFLFFSDYAFHLLEIILLHRQGDNDIHPFTRVIVHFNLALMGGNDFMNNGQTQT
jgi:hypothetical protein